jgi:hypothetical protein
MSIEKLMNHIDEHILELYALGAASVKKNRREIEAHLVTCVGCRRLLEQMRLFYDEAEGKSREQNDFAMETRKSLLRRSQLLVPLEKIGPPGVFTEVRTPLDKFRWFVRMHPVVTTGGVLASVAAIAVLLIVFKTRPIQAINASYVHLNESQGMLEVYNAEDEKIWQIASPEIINAAQTERTHRISYTEVSDLEGDGRKEIVTVLPCLGEDRSQRNIIHIFSSDKKLRKRIEFGGPIEYRGTAYNDSHSSFGLVVGDFVGTGKKEIVVTSTGGRSPCAIQRFDADGDLLGIYWHFGTLDVIHAMDLGHDGKIQIVLSGLHDPVEPRGDRYPVIVVLDPSKIEGNTESSASPGFGLSPSNAELYYVRLPRSELNRATNSEPYISRIDTLGFSAKNVLGFWIMGTASDQLPMFEYYFSGNLQTITVESEDRTDRIYQKRFQTVLDRDYLEKLKQSVMYWNGEKWQGERTTVSFGRVIR